MKICWFTVDGEKNLSSGSDLDLDKTMVNSPKLLAYWYQYSNYASVSALSFCYSAGKTFLGIMIRLLYC